VRAICRALVPTVVTALVVDLAGNGMTHTDVLVSFNFQHYMSLNLVILFLC
jgi:hypothetical protein